MAGEDYLGLLGVGDLAAFNQSVTQSDPYGITSRTLNSWAPDTSTWSPVESGVGLFAKSFLAGLLGNQARENAAQQTNALISVLPQLRSNPMSVAMPEGMNPEAFANFKGTAVLKNMQRQISEGEDEKKAITQLMRSVVGEKLKNNEISADAAATAIKTGDYSSVLQPASTDGISPLYQKGLKLFNGNKTLAEDYVKANDPTFANKKDQVTSIDKANALAFTTKQFDDAKKLSSIFAAIPGTTAANEIVGIQTNLRTKIQQILGREMNGPEQEKLMAALPDWNDSKSQIDAKKNRFLELIDNLSKGGGEIPNAGTPPLTQEKYNQLRAQGLTKEQIKAQFSF